MPPELFWEGDVWLAPAYVRANQLRAQRKSEEMWLQGAYIYNAVAVAVSNAFRKKGAKPQKYLSEPVRVVPLTEEEKEAKAEEERRKLVAYLNSWQANWKAK